MHTITASFGEGVARLNYNVPVACMYMGMGGELMDSKVERLRNQAQSFIYLVGVIGCLHVGAFIIQSSDSTPYIAHLV